VTPASTPSLGRQLVEPGGQALGEARRVAEDDRGAVGEHELAACAGRCSARCCALPLHPRWGRAAASDPRGGDSAHRAHVFHGHHDLDLERLADAGVDDGGPGVARRPRGRRSRRGTVGDLLERALRGREPDALRRPVGDGSSRSSVSIRWAPRLVVAIAWISSMITASTFTSVSRAARVSIRYSDSGVVMSRSGGRRTSAGARRRLVSPVRIATVGRRERHAQPLGGEADAHERCPQVLLDVERQRPQRRDVEHRVRALGCGRPRLRRGDQRSIPQRNAVSVLPDPVGAQISVCSPARSPATPAPAAAWARGTSREPLTHRRRKAVEHLVVSHACRLRRGCHTEVGGEEAALLATRHAWRVARLRRRCRNASSASLRRCACWPCRPERPPSVARIAADSGSRPGPQSVAHDGWHGGRTPRNASSTTLPRRSRPRRPSARSRRHRRWAPWLRRHRALRRGREAGVLPRRRAHPGPFPQHAAARERGQAHFLLQLSDNFCCTSRNECCR
jgi:hypothetical protein